MIVFEFEEFTPTIIASNRKMFGLCCTSCDGDDEEHSNEIYEQLDAETAGLANE